MIEVRQLVKRYGPTVAVDGISFEVERGEIVGFLGPNGAGKTTTLRILAGFMPATAGSARVAGHDVFSESLDIRRNIGYLPEGVPLYPEMRVQEYLTYRARVKGIRRRDRRNRVGHVMERCGVTEVRRKLIGSLSKGYRQRVGLAEALVHDPPVLILDEPTIGLDPNQIRHVRQLIRDLGEDHTVLLSTHILPEVEMVCQRVVILHNGRLVFQDSLDAINRQGADKTLVTAEVRAPADAATSALLDLPGVLDLRWEEAGAFTRLELRVDPASDVREQVFQCAVRKGWTLRELRWDRPSLEDIFVRLTARENG